jgi:hypothetical protein
MEHKSAVANTHSSLPRVIVSVLLLTIETVIVVEVARALPCTGIHVHIPSD